MAVPGAFRNGPLAAGARLDTVASRGAAVLLVWGEFLMRKLTFTTLAAAIALAGCGGGNADADGDGKITNEEAAAAAKGMVAPMPGEYETTMKVLEIELPEVAGVDPAQMKQMMEGMMNTTTKQCITAEDAQNAARQFAQAPGDEESCTYSKFNVSGGQIDATMSCKGEGGADMTMQLAGTMGREASNMTMELDQVAPNMPGGATGKTHFKLQVDSKRIGDCPA